MKPNNENAMSVNQTEETIPADLLTLPQWVAWNENKAPINPRTGSFAKSSDPATWGTYEEAVACCRERGLKGVGFVFSGKDPFVGIDLDHSIDADTGEILTWAKEIVDRFGSYTEISPSGKGLHIFVRGHLPSGRRRSENKEIYDCGRYFTVTGDHLQGTPKTIESREAEIGRFCLEMEKPLERTAAGYRIGQVSPDDQSLIERASNAENGEKFSRLWSGNFREYPSQSEADLALCTMLSFWTNRDHERIDQLFRKSGLMRPKWERHVGNGTTYGQATIQKAVAANTTGYTPGFSDINRAEAEGSFKLTDLGNAERLVKHFFGDILYCHEWKKWLIWDGTRWAVDRRDSIKQKAKQVIRGIYGEAEKTKDSRMREEIARHAISSESGAKIRSMLFLAESEVPVTTDEMDQDPWLLTCMNGTLNLETGQIRPARKEDRITQLAPVRFDPEAACPQWDAFLERIMDGNEALIAFLQRAVGYSLTGNTREQCLFILFGSGANGKSTFLQTVSAMMGDYAKQTPTETLLVKRSGAIPNDIARLKGSRFVTASEAEADQRLAESLIKQMTGSDTVSARFLHQEYFDFGSTHKVFLATNHDNLVKSRKCCFSVIPVKTGIQ